VSEHTIEPLDLSDRATAADVLAVQRAAYRVEADLIRRDGIRALHESLEELLDAVAVIVDDRFGGTVERADTTELYLARRLET